MLPFVIFADRFILIIRFLLGHLLVDILFRSINRHRSNIFVVGIGVHFFYLFCTITLMLDYLEIFDLGTLIIILIIILALAFTIRQQRLSVTISLRRAVFNFTATDGEGISWDV